MPKDLVSEQRLPTPVTLPSTGNPKADAAIAQLLVFPHSPAHPSTRPGGNDYDKVSKAGTAAGSKALCKLLDTPGLFEVGQSVWDEARYNKLSPAKKKEYRKASEAAAEARKVRIAFLSWLIEAVIPDGYKQLVALIPDREIDFEVRHEIVRYLRSNFDSKKQLLDLVKALPRSEWHHEDNNRVVEELIACWHQADPKGAFDALHAEVTPENIKKKYWLIDAIITTVAYPHHVKPDPRWAVVMAGMVASDLDVIAVKAVLTQPLDPAVIPAMLKALGPLDKLDYFYTGLLDAVARVGTMEIVPILQRAIQVDSKDAEQIVSKIPSKAKAVIAAVKATPVDVEDAARERATLVYKKTKAPKKPKIPPLAKQIAQHQKLFADAGIPDAYELVKTSVALLPTRVDEKTLKVGATKLGGHPDLPADAKWPRVAGEPLTFLAQLNFADFAKLTDELPKTGTLALFVDDDASSDSGAYLENAKAIYTKAGAKLVRHEVPEDFVATIYQACKVELVAKLSMPSPSNAHVTKALDEEAIATYESEVFAHSEDLPKVLGYRDYGYDAEEPATARLLMQFPVDNQSGMEFGDADALSIFIATKDLAKGNFNKIWPHCGD